MSTGANETAAVGKKIGHDVKVKGGQFRIKQDEWFKFLDDVEEMTQRLSVFEGMKDLFCPVCKKSFNRFFFFFGQVRRKRGVHKQRCLVAWCQ